MNGDYFHHLKGFLLNTHVYIIMESKMVFFVSQVMIYDHDPPSKERLAKIPSPLTVKYNGAFKYVSLFFYQNPRSLGR